MSKKPKEENLVRDPNKIYIPTTRLRNHIGEVIDIALSSGKEIILEKHGRGILKLSKVQETDTELIQRRKEALKKFYGSMPDLPEPKIIEKEFRKSFKPRNYFLKDDG